MTQQRSEPFCNVIGCRKPAVVFLVDSRGARPEPTDDGLCEPCYLNLILTRPDLAERYRRLGPTPTSTSDTQPRA